MLELRSADNGESEDGRNITGRASSVVCCVRNGTLPIIIFNRITKLEEKIPGSIINCKNYNWINAKKIANLILSLRTFTIYVTLMRLQCGNPEGGTAGTLIGNWSQIRVYLSLIFPSFSWNKTFFSLRIYVLSVYVVAYLKKKNLL